MLHGEGHDKTVQAAPLQLKVATRLAGVMRTEHLHRHTIVFTHVGKTGGTTLDHIMRVATMAAGKKPYRPRSRRVRAAAPQHLQEFLDFDDIDFEQLSACDYVSGHFPFGIHARLSRPCLYITLLREPAARLLSNIRFGLDRGKWSRDVPIAALFEQGRLIDNMQTRQIAGIADRTAPCTPRMLAAALDNLQSSYAVVGITERFNETLKALITLFGWPDIAYSDRQVSRAPSDPDLEARVKDAAERYFAFDMELYAHARARATPWNRGILDGTMTGHARQDTVLVTTPMLRRDKRAVGLVPRTVFDTKLCPAVRQQGGEVVFV